MKLLQLKTLYLNNSIPKSKYISRMFDIHRNLFDYSEFIKNTEIKKIEISQNSVVLTTTEEIKIVCPKNDKRSVPLEMLNFGSYEKAEMTMILSLIENDFSVLDVGANLGLYSLYISKHFRKAKIFAFEPIKTTYDYLKINIKFNDTPNIRAYNFGFSNTTGRVLFYYKSEESGISSMANLKEDKATKKVYCKITTIDSFVESKKIKVDFIKCDVEGSELLVFKGGIETIANYKPIIFTEMLRKWSAKFNYHPNAIISLLKSIGYECFTVDNGKLKKFINMTDETVDTNFFFLHSIKHKLKIKKYL